MSWTGSSGALSANLSTPIGHHDQVGCSLILDIFVGAGNSSVCPKIKMHHLVHLKMWITNDGIPNPTVPSVDNFRIRNPKVYSFRSASGTSPSSSKSSSSDCCASDASPVSNYDHPDRNPSLSARLYHVLSGRVYLRSSRELHKPTPTPSDRADISLQAFLPRPTSTPKHRCQTLANVL